MVLSVARLKEDRRFGVDSRWSWVVAGFLSWVMFMTTLSQQAMGVLFYGIVHDYGVNRGEAAWPIVFSGTSICLAGPMMGYFCRRFSCQAVLFASSVAGGVSLGACCLTDDVRLLTVLFGFVQGVAMSGSSVGTSVLVSQHFERRRAIACSVMFFFSGINMIVAPLLAEFFRSTYGIRGTFLLLGALTLNACPAVIVLKSPVWMEHKKQTCDRKETGEKKDTTGVLLDVQRGNPPKGDILYMKVGDQEMGSANDNLQSSETPKTIISLSEPPRDSHSNVPTFRAKLGTAHEDSQPTFAPMARLFLTVPFALHALTFIVLIFGMATFLLLSVDIGKDRGLSPSSAVFLMTAFAVGDLILRPLSGLVIDIGFISLEVVMCLGFFFQAIVFEAFVWLRTFPLMLACSVLIGASNGSKISLQAPAIVKDFGIDALPIIIGGVMFCNGVALLTRPALVGYCRDVLGSYDLMLHLVLISSVVLGVAWLVKYFARRRNQR